MGSEVHKINPTRYSQSLAIIMRRLLLLVSVLLFGLFETNAQDSTAFDFWSDRELIDRSFARAKNSLTTEEYEVLNDFSEIPDILTKVLSNIDEASVAIFKVPPEKYYVKFANPDQRYRAADEINEKNVELPTRKILTLAKSGNSILLAYKHGGIGVHNHLVWAKMQGEKLIDFWIADTHTDIYTIADLVKLMNNGPQNLLDNSGCR